jgi:hypothetical protein
MEIQIQIRRRYVLAVGQESGCIDTVNILDFLEQKGQFNLFEFISTLYLINNCMIASILKINYHY